MPEERNQEDGFMEDGGSPADSTLRMEEWRKLRIQARFKRSMDSWEQLTSSRPAASSSGPSLLLLLVLLSKLLPKPTLTQAPYA